MADELEVRAAGLPATRRRRWPWAVAAGVAALGVFVAVWFQPQKLFIDERVDDPVPVAAVNSTPAPADEQTAATPPSPSVSRNVAGGMFVSLDHGTSGIVRILELADGTRVVRLEDLDTDNGPDLYLYLSTNPPDGAESAFDDDHVNLGRLRGNLGNQNYDLPAATDLSRYASVVIWCDRFDSAFGVADLGA